MTALLPALIAALLVLRQPLLVILIALAAAAHLAWGRGHLEYIVEDMWNALDKELILSIPLFLLCGQVISRGSIARRLVAILQALTCRLPGGLGVACVLACGVDASISGSSIATMLAVGSVMVPGLLHAGYARRYALGAVMAGGTLGIIIPPSIPMIVYGIVTETSIVELFRAGIGPGLLLVGVFAVHAWWVNRRMPSAPFDMARFVHVLQEGVWAALLPVILLGGIYSGFFGVTEAAAVALAYAVAIETFVHRELTARHLYEILLEGVRLAGALLPIFAVASSLMLLVNEHQVAMRLVEWLQGHVSSAITFMVLVNVLLLVAGCLMPSDVAVLVLAPLLAPLAEAYGYDKVLFGIIMLLNLEIGFLTPPVGLNLLVAAGAFKQPFGFLCRAALPFIAMMLGCLVLVIWQPWIALGLVE